MEISLILVDIEDKRVGFIGDQKFFHLNVVILDCLDCLECAKLIIAG